MKRWIYTHCEIAGDPKQVETALVSSATDLLRIAVAAPDEEPAADGSFLMELESEVAMVDFAKQIRVSTGVVRRDGNRVVVPVQWHADPVEWLFPRFEGGFEWEAWTSRLGQLTLYGSYDLPLGLVGTVVDVTVLRNVAHRTAEHLVQALARELERRLREGPPAPPVVVGAEQARGPLHVRDVMTANPLVIDESLPLRTGALILFSGDVSGAPVVRADGGLVGVLSEQDLLTKEAEQRFGWGRGAGAEWRRREATTVGEACSSPAVVTSPDARLSAAARLMLDHDVSRLVVVGAGRIAGIVTRHDVLSALIRDDRELLAEVHEILAEGGHGRVRASVEWGVVTLRGTTKLHTTAASLRRRIARIDGVVDVDADDLHWEIDDVIPTIASMPGA